MTLYQKMSSDDFWSLMIVFILILITTFHTCCTSHSRRIEIERLTKKMTEVYEAMIDVVLAYQKGYFAKLREELRTYPNSTLFFVGRMSLEDIPLFQSLISEETMVFDERRNNFGDQALETLLKMKYVKLEDERPSGKFYRLDKTFSQKLQKALP